MIPTEKNPMKLDAKFYGEIRKVKDDSVVPDDEYVIFLAKDNAFAAVLPEYRLKCLVLGADQEQIKAVDRLMQRVALWRKLHPSKLKVPDAAGEKLLRMTAPLCPQSAELELDAGMDWEQVRLNGGPPCFSKVRPDRLCGRAKSWVGHPIDHEYVSLEAYARAAAPRQCFHGCTACEGSGVEYDSPGKTRPCSECGGKGSIYAQLEKVRASNERLIQMYADLSNSIRPNDKLPRVGESPAAAPAAPLPQDMRIYELERQVRAADAVMKAIDREVEAGRIGSRSEIADRRLDYSQPYTYFNGERPAKAGE